MIVSTGSPSATGCPDTNEMQWEPRLEEILLDWAIAPTRTI